MKSLASRLFLLGILLALVDSTQGEVFVLAKGGQIEGELLNPNETPRKTFVIRTTSGVQVTLDAAEVAQRLELSPAEIEYGKVKGEYADTTEGQWNLAEWCGEKRLPVQRKEHLERVIALDPNHKQARAALGYSQIGGKWSTQEEVMQSRGYRRFQGRWRTPQEIEVIERKQKQEVEEKSWYVKIKRWSGWLGGEKTDEAKRHFATINDPAAVKPLGDFLKRDQRWPAQAVYIETLSRIGTPEALGILAARAIEDPVEEVRMTCLDHLKKRKHPEVIAHFVGKLKNQKDNAVINLAGIALRETGDETAVDPLIEALVTEHKFKITSGNPGQTSAGFNSRGGGGISMGSSTRVVSVPMQNQAVLDALISITGVNFNFDVQAWKHWRAAKTKRPPLDARRG